MVKNTDSNQKLSEILIWILMFILSIIFGLMEISHGILSSCVIEIKQELKTSDKEFGLFGTFEGLGSCLGSFAFTLIIERVNHKYLICTMLLINCISHFSFFFGLKYPILLISRFLSGFALVFSYLYFPMWVDTFAMKTWVNFMQTFVLFTNRIGSILGYFFFLLFGGHQWKYGFLLESITVSFLVFFMLLIPFEYYDKNYKNPDYIKDDNFPEKEEIPLSFPKIQDQETIMKDIICNIPFILISLYRGNKLFINIAIGFWYSDYLQTTLMEKNLNIIFWSYSISIVISSIFGILLGGVIIYFIGGTHSKHSYITMTILQFISLIFGFSSSFTHSVFIFSILLSLYVLHNSASGLIAVSASFEVMPKTLKGTAVGIYSIIVDLTGFLPASYSYVIIKDLVGGNYIIAVLMLYGLIGCAELFIADIYMRIKKIKLYKEEIINKRMEIETELDNIII